MWWRWREGCCGGSGGAGRGGIGGGGIRQEAVEETAAEDVGGCGDRRTRWWRWNEVVKGERVEEEVVEW